MEETTRIENKLQLTPELDVEKEVIASLPRNKELMRIFRDVELVESLGSGIPRILRAYGEDSFKFTDNFIRITFPVSVQVNNVESHTKDNDTAQDTAQDTAHVQRIILSIEDEMSREVLQGRLSISHRQHFIKEYLKPAIEAGLIELTIPDKPKSKNQKYRLTPKGRQLQEFLKAKK